MGTYGKVRNFDSKKSKPNETHIFMFYVGNNRGQLSINADPYLVRSVRAYCYAQNYIDVGRAGVDQKIDREVLGSILKYVNDELGNPDSRYYTDGYYKGTNRPEDIIIDHDRLMELSGNKDANSYISLRELHDKESKSIDDEIKRSYKASGM